MSSVIKIRRRKSGRRNDSRRPSIIDMVSSLYQLALLTGILKLSAQCFELLLTQLLDGCAGTRDKQRQNPDGSPSRSQLLLRTLAVSMCVDGKCLRHIAAPQHLDRLICIVNQTSSRHFRRSNDRIGSKQSFQCINIDFLILGAEHIRKTALEWQAANERELTAFKVGVLAATFARAGTFRAASSRFTLPSGDTVTYSL